MEKDDHARNQSMINHHVEMCSGKNKEQQIKDNARFDKLVAYCLKGR